MVEQSNESSGTPALAPPSADVDKYIRMITILAVKFWKRLPEEHKRYLDVDDLIQDGVVLLYSVTAQYDPTRQVKLSTFFYTSLSNYYRSVLERCHTKMRTAHLVEIKEEITVAEDLQAEILDAERKIERFLQLASDPLRRFLRLALFSGRTEMNPTGDHVREFRCLAKRTGVTVNDFRLVLAASMS